MADPAGASPAAVEGALASAPGVVGTPRWLLAQVLSVVGYPYVIIPLSVGAAAWLG